MLTTGLAPVEACLLARKRKTSHHRHRGACLREALFRIAKTAPHRDEPGRGVDTNVMAPFWLINTRPRGQAPVVRKSQLLNWRVGLNRIWRAPSRGTTDSSPAIYRWVRGPIETTLRPVRDARIATSATSRL
jgi:hypothetical protein